MHCWCFLGLLSIRLYLAGQQQPEQHAGLCDEDEDLITPAGVHFKLLRAARQQ